MLFLQNVDPSVKIASPFWSLATEWHFYLVLPLILVSVRKIGFSRTMFLCSVVSVIAGLWFSYHDPYNWSTSVWVRLIEFLWGVLAAEIYLTGRNKKSGAYVSWWLALLIAYLGRLMMVTETLNLLGPIKFIVKAFAGPVMTLGFAVLILYLLENSSSFAARFFSSAPLAFIGRISYSIYLWHWLVKNMLAKFLIDHFGGFSQFAPVLGFLVIATVTILVSVVSYKIFEEPYFKRKRIVEPITITS